MSPSAPIDGEEVNGKAAQNNVTYQISEDQLIRLLGTKQANNVFQSFADPGPLGFISFVLCLTPTIACLNFWGSLTPLSMVALVGQFYLTGGLGLWIAAIMEYLRGSTFAMITFASYGSFWFGFAFLNAPEAGLAQALGGPSSPLLTDAIGKCKDVCIAYSISDNISSILSFRRLPDRLCIFQPHHGCQRFSNQSGICHDLLHGFHWLNVSRLRLHPYAV